MKPRFLSTYLEYFFPRYFDAAVASLGLLEGEFVPEELELLHQVPFVSLSGQLLAVFQRTFVWCLQRLVGFF